MQQAVALSRKFSHKYVEKTTFKPAELQMFFVFTVLQPTKSSAKVFRLIWKREYLAICEEQPHSFQTYLKKTSFAAAHVLHRKLAAQFWSSSGDSASLHSLLDAVIEIFALKIQEHDLNTCALADVTVIDHLI